jgi:single-strand DNA-binding protein
VIVTGRLEQRSWETEDHEKRSRIEIIADEIGPSLRWATATVERTDRRTSDDGGSYSSGSSGGGSRRAETPSYDEEPF